MTIPTDLPPGKRPYLEVVYMDKASRQRARAALGRSGYAQLERAPDAYLVMGDGGAIVTCVHRTGKLRF
jgi:hypothetical protein